MMAHSTGHANNSLFPLQIPRSAQDNLLYQTVLQDPNNRQAIKEMEEEISLWIFRFILAFLFALGLYINLYYTIPLELLFAPLIILDFFLIWYYANKSRSDS